MRTYTKTEEKLGFEKILNAVAENCLCVAGKRLVYGVRFLHEKADVERELGLTDEFLSIILSNKAFPSEDFFDMSGELKRLQVQGTCMSVVSLVELYRSLATVNRCVEFFERDEKNEYPLLKSLCEGVEADEQILDRCAALLTSEGDIADNASSQLLSIRTEIRHAKSEVERRLRKLLNLSKQEGWTSPDAELVLRDGRSVIPIASADKRRLQGFVLDESSTGRTSYVEPAQVVEMNNRVRELEFEEQREVYRILSEFTDFLRPFIPMLLCSYGFLARVDYIRAKAVYGFKLRAGKPILSPEHGFSWFEARHPLLEESLKRHGKTIVPLRIELNPTQRILIISGPNAGGKSACLKTVGLLQYMLQCGLLVPMKQTSECCLFDDLFIDIGDEQNLENDLSTYSSHLLNMKHLLGKADGGTLFLIDECGSGTDPNIGGAIAEAVLEELNAREAFGVVTTHYSNLKLLSGKCHGICNAAMLFDTEAMKPLYRLSVGNPGSSFAFEIARSIGLPKRIIDAASEKIGSGFVDFEQSLQTLAVEKMEIKAKQNELKLADELLDSLVTQYNNRNAEIARKEKEILLQARRQAKEILQDANRQVERAVSQIRTSKADKTATKEARSVLKAKIEETQNKIERTEREIAAAPKPAEPQKTHIAFDRSPLCEGDYVLLVEQNTYGQVVRLRKSKAELACGNINLTLPISQIRKVKRESYLAAQKRLNSSSANSQTAGLMEDINRLRAEFQYQIDLRGERADEALKRLGKQIDTARLLGETELSVLHGKGDGILKTVLRDYLKNNPEVESFKAARLEFGGEGITQIKLK